MVFIGCKSEESKALEEAKKLIENERYTEAIEYLSNVIEKFSNYAPLFYERGYCYIHESQNEKASNDFNNCVRIDSKYANGYYGIAMVYMDNSQYDLAEMNYNKAVEFAKNNERKSVYLSGLARLYNIKKEYIKAIEYINQAMSLSRDSDLYYSLGLYLYNNEQKNDAVEAWSLGLEKNNFRQIEFKHYIYYELALYYFDEEEYGKSRENIEKALELSPNNDNYVSLFNRIKRFN
jgi:tetratricopeptide (TPR) repeat protein